MAHNPFSVKIAGGDETHFNNVELFVPSDTFDIHDALYTTELVNQLRDLEDGTLALVGGALDQEVLELVGNTAVFNEVPDLAKTRTASMHEVTFGQLIVTSMFGQERAELVACKPFNMVNIAAQEFSLARYFSGESGVPTPFKTFRPLGAFRTSSGTLSLVSKLRSRS